MIQMPEDHPVQLHHTSRILDSSKIKKWMECNRKFLFEYVLGWRPDRSNHHLIHGRAWHEAMEVFARRRVDPSFHGYVEDLTDSEAVESLQRRALKAYMLEYEPYFPAGSDEHDANFPKNTVGAARALKDYILHHSDEQLEVIDLNGEPAIEIGGKVILDLDEDVFVTFRLDALVRDPFGQIWVWERKTTKGFYTNWYTQWENSMQISTYLHAAWALLGHQDVAGVLIDGVAFQKTQTQFERYAVQRSPQQMQLWWENTKRHVKMMREEYLRMAEQGYEDETFTAFPLNLEACSSWAGCTYLSLCTAHANVLRYVENLHRAEQEAPPGFAVEHWDPMAHEPRIKVELGG